MTLPRFSLRLLLVAVAVLCAWLAWVANERQFVRERRIAFEDLRRGRVKLGLVILRTENRGFDYPDRLSTVRRILGDRQIIAIVFRQPLTARQHVEYRRLFPEAQFVLDGVGPPYILGPGAYQDAPLQVAGP